MQGRMKDNAKSNIPVLVATSATAGVSSRSEQSVNVVTLGFGNNVNGIRHPFEGVFMLKISCSINSSLYAHYLMLDNIYGSSKPMHINGSAMTVGDLRGNYHLCTFDTETRIVNVIA